MQQLWQLAAAVLVVGAIVAPTVRLRRSGTVGPGASGAVYDLLNQDKRAAVEIVVEERAGYRDPEDRDGDLRQLEHAPRK